MEVAGMGLAIVGYALFYTGASNLFTGGKGWGFLQSLLNKGENNQSGAFANTDSTSGKSNSPSKGGGGLLGGLWDYATTLDPFSIL
jgi:hypothetical protein